MAEEYLTFSQAQQKIQILRERSVVILGIERLVQQDDESLFPDMAGIADFSDASVQDSYEASLDYFSDYGEDPRELFIITY